jgi:hypothetical protein
MGAVMPAVVQPPAPTVPPASETEKPTIRIARVTVSGGDVDFSDRFIKPNFNAKFHDLGGRIPAWNPSGRKRADVLLEGMWSNHAPVKITGQDQPADRKALSGPESEHFRHRTEPLFTIFRKIHRLHPGKRKADLQRGLSRGGPQAGGDQQHCHQSAHPG